MHPEEQIEALAELDGWTVIHHEGKSACHEEQFTGDKEGSMSLFIPNYLTSYNAIIPLIQKQIGKGNTGHLFILHLWEVCGLQKLRGSLLLSRQDTAADHNLLVDKIWELFVKPTPAQLCEALLRALGKWKD